MIEFILKHKIPIKEYQQIAIPWAYNRNGTINKNVQYAQGQGVLKGIAFDDMDRLDVVNYFTQDLYRGFMATLLWGGKHKLTTKGFEKIIGINPIKIEENLQRVKDDIVNGDIKNAFKSMLRGGINHIDEVDYPFFTKLLYFMGKAFAPELKPMPLILDNHMQYVHCALLLDNNENEFYKWPVDSCFRWRHSTPDFAYKLYGDYIKRLDNIAEDWTAADNIEAFLFAMHPASVDSFIYQEVYNQRSF